jgi:carboxylesterase
MTQLIAGTEPFSLGSGPVGALLVHGFTGSPQGLRGLGEYLAGRGIAVEGVRLPGHGTTWQDLNTKTAADWVGEVEAGYDRIAGRAGDVFAVGLSFGAALVLDFAARRPDDIKGIVTLAGFVHTGDPRRFFAPIIKLIQKSIPGVGNDIADPDGHEIAYERFPTAAGHSMLRFIRRARAQLGRVRAPILVVHGRDDHTVEPRNARIIFDNVASADKELVWCERSYHVITLDYDRDMVLDRAHRFIEERGAHAL